MNRAREVFWNAASIAWRPPDTRTPWEWCEDHIRVDNTSPFPGKWRASTSPWVKEVMEVAADRRFTICAVKCSAQSSKTQTALNLLCYNIVEDPGPSMYVMANKDDAEEFVSDRFRPTLLDCKPAKEKLISEKKSAFRFAGGMPLYFVGAGSSAKLQGKPIRKLMLDEVRNYPPGALDTVLKRVRSFGSLSQVFMISTPDDKGDAVDRHFEQGDQRTFHFPCPKCGFVQPLKFEQLKWRTNEETKPAGRYNFDKLAETIRYQCANQDCKFEISDTPADRKSICKTGYFVRLNPSAPIHHVSFTWNALLPFWVKWRSIVEEYINGRYAARNGDLNPLKTFYNETLGLSWDDQLGVIEDFGFLDARKRDYGFDEVWAEEVARFMFSDRQEAGGEHYPWLIRAFGNFGKSRLIAYGVAATTAELEAIRIQYNVKLGNAMIDSGWKASEVYRFCVSSGWKAFKGEPNFEFFLHRIKISPDKWRTVRRIWERTFVDAFIGLRKGFRPKMRKQIPLFRHVGNETKDLLAQFMRGLVGDWTIPACVGRDYLRQVSSERREEHTDPKGNIQRIWRRVHRDNHYFDCELGCLVAAVITKLIAGYDELPNKTEKRTK